MKNDHYQAGLFDQSVPKGKTFGHIEVLETSLRFEGNGHVRTLPLDELELRRGGANDRLIFFSHPASPDVTIHTPKFKILDAAPLVENFGTGRQIRKIRASKRRSNFILLCILMFIPILCYGLFASRGPIARVIARELPPDLEPMDDVRFSIEFSVAQALNEDIIKIFATLESLENIIGGPENMFATEYQGLTRLREIYFNRLTGSVNYTAFFEFFRWLDESFDIIIENLIPKKTNYLGFNMIVEPHILERPRVAYGSGDIYLGVNDRRNLKGALYLRQLIANMKRR